jgi:hypothetical protein
MIDFAKTKDFLRSLDAIKHYLTVQDISDMSEIVLRRIMEMESGVKEV